MTAGPRCSRSRAPGQPSRSARSPMRSGAADSSAGDHAFPPGAGLSARQARPARPCLRLLGRPRRRGRRGAGPALGFLPRRAPRPGQAPLARGAGDGDQPHQRRGDGAHQHRGVGRPRRVDRSLPCRSRRAALRPARGPSRELPADAPEDGEAPARPLRDPGGSRDGHPPRARQPPRWTRSCHRCPSVSGCSACRTGCATCSPGSMASVAPSSRCTSGRSSASSAGGRANWASATAGAAA